MASKPQTDEFAEYCERCGRETAHAVSVELLTESNESENAQFSREPYRVAECLACGSESHTRMNNA